LSMRWWYWEWWRSEICLLFVSNLIHFNYHKTRRKCCV